MKTLIISALIFLSTMARAEMVENDWLNDGDGKITLDTLTNLEWLDFSETLNMSILEVADNINTDGHLSEFRLPNEDEVSHIIDTYLTGDPTTNKAQWVEKDATSDAFGYFFTVTYPSTSPLGLTYALHYLSDGNVVLSGMRDDVVDGNYTGDYVYYNQWDASHIISTTKSRGMSVWLVRDYAEDLTSISAADVFEPTGTGLLGLLLIVCFGYQTKRHPRRLS